MGEVLVGGPVEERDSADFGEMVREGLTRAGVELGRLRRIASLQASLTGARLRRRGQREALAERALALHRRGELQNAELVTLCEGMETTDADIRALEDQIAAVRRGEEGPVEPAPAGRAGAGEGTPHGVVVLPNGERLCAVCRGPLGADDTFCPTCGVRL
jgi:hypothetical protein